MSSSIYNASNLTDLNTAIGDANNASSGSAVLIFLQDSLGNPVTIQLSSGDAIAMLNSAAQVTIAGPSSATPSTIDGGSVAGGFTVLSGNVTFQSLTLQNFAVTGVCGGMGAGAALYALNPYCSTLTPRPWQYGNNTDITGPTTITIENSLIQSCEANGSAPYVAPSLSGTGGTGGANQSFYPNANGTGGTSASCPTQQPPVLGASQLSPGGNVGASGAGGAGGPYDGPLPADAVGGAGGQGGAALFGGGGGAGGGGGGGGGGGCGSSTTGVFSTCWTPDRGTGGAAGGTGGPGGQGGFGGGGGGGGSGGGGGGGGAGGTNGTWACGREGGAGGANGTSGNPGLPGFGGGTGLAGVAVPSVTPPVVGEPGAAGGSGYGGSNRPGGSGGAGTAPGQTGAGAALGGAIFFMGGTQDQYNDNPTEAPALTLNGVLFNGNTATATSPAQSAGNDIFLQGWGELTIMGEGTTDPEVCDEAGSGISAVAGVSTNATDAYGFAVNGGSGLWTGIPTPSSTAACARVAEAEAA